ncbi:hypothetical protein AX14_002055 [Amanita brunnescens Koide BX004]|nr:hypothetical protein AX14_002055 [Amanita brunnescens Koide BX004]
MDTRKLNIVSRVPRIFPSSKHFEKTHSQKASSRAWIDAFFLRANAMLPLDNRMILNTEHVIPTVPIQRMPAPNMLVLKTDMPTSASLLVVEVKLHYISDYMPQAASEIHACGRYLKKKVIHGVLANGHEWMFLLVKLNDDGNGAPYRKSVIMNLWFKTNPEDRKWYLSRSLI